MISQMISAPELELPGISHGFFTREGGHSQGIFASLNTGLGSGDDPDAVRKNRAKVACKLGVEIDRLITGYQVHGTDVAVINGPLAERPKVDGLVSNTPGIAIGILSADCGPLLFADGEAGVIGAAHAGWKGALHGVWRTTVEAMEKLGAKRERIVAALGPTIRQDDYEVGPEFLQTFLAVDSELSYYFIKSWNTGRYLFDLPHFLTDHIIDLGVGRFHDLGLSTYSDAQRFYSYRRATHRGERDYGRLMSAIALKE